MTAKRGRSLPAGVKDFLIMLVAMVIVWLLALAATARGEELSVITLPRNPAPARQDNFQLKYWALTGITAGAVYGDAYTTVAVAGHSRNCHEGGSPWLYGRRPTAARTYGVMSAELAIGMTGAYLLKRHHSKFWGVPLMVLSSTHGYGAVGNVGMNCR